MDARPEDLRWFAENLDITQFSALSQGIGVGELKPKQNNPAPHNASKVFSQQTLTKRRQIPQTPMQQEFPAAQQMQRPVHKDSTPPLNKGGGFFSLRRLEALSLDLLLVITAFAFSLALAALVSGLKNGINSDGWIDLAAFKWVRQFSGVELSAMVGGLLVGYIALFKLSMGQTPGENLSGCSKNHKDILGYKGSVNKQSL